MDVRRQHRLRAPVLQRWGGFRGLVALLMVLSLSGLSHAAEETLEAAVHLADTGHVAHADHHPEGEAVPGSEHFCFGAVHHCSCCPTALAATGASTPLPPRSAANLCHPTIDEDGAIDGIRQRIDRPPRA